MWDSVTIKSLESEVFKLPGFLGFPGQEALLPARAGSINSPETRLFKTLLPASVGPRLKRDPLSLPSNPQRGANLATRIAPARGYPGSVKRRHLHHCPGFLHV